MAVAVGLVAGDVCAGEVWLSILVEEIALVVLETEDHKQ